MDVLFFSCLFVYIVTYVFVKYRLKGELSVSQISEISSCKFVFEKYFYILFYVVVFLLIYLKTKYNIPILFLSFILLFFIKIYSFSKLIKLFVHNDYKKQIMLYSSLIFLLHVLLYALFFIILFRYIN